jgi:hypothetical protein
VQCYVRAGYFVNFVVSDLAADAANQQTSNCNMRIVGYFRLIVALVLACSNGIGAQTLEKAHILTEPLQYSNQGRFRGCGLHLKLLQDTNGSTRDYLSISINFFSENTTVGMIKTSLSRATIAVPPVVKPQGLLSSWIRVRGGDPLAVKKVVKGEDQSLLVVVDVIAALELSMAVLRAEDELQVGFRQPGSRFERVFYATPSVDAETRAVFQACFKEFMLKMPK